MAVNVFCDNPIDLLNKIKASIHDGSIETWLIDKDSDLTHSPAQWKNQAWFRPTVGAGKLVFYIIGPQSKRMSRTVYGVYHGRLIEMLLTHFDLQFSRASATALPTTGDSVGG